MQYDKVIYRKYNILPVQHPSEISFSTLLRGTSVKTDTVFCRFSTSAFASSRSISKNKISGFIQYSTTGSRYRLETFFAEEESHTWVPRWASNLWPLHVNVEILSRSPQETDDFTGMLENNEIKHKIYQKWPSRRYHGPFNNWIIKWMGNNRHPQFGFVFSRFSKRLRDAPPVYSYTSYAYLYNTKSTLLTVYIIGRIYPQPFKVFRSIVTGSII